MTDSVCTCRKCKSNLCYQIFSEDLVSFKCLVCGFESNSKMMKNTEYTKAYEEILPQLYKEIKYIDEDGYVWYPQFVIKEGVGTIFVDGTDKNNWDWAFSKHVLIEPHELARFQKLTGDPDIKYKSSSDIFHFPQATFLEVLEACKMI